MACTAATQETSEKTGFLSAPHPPDDYRKRPTDDLGAHLLSLLRGEGRGKTAGDDVDKNLGDHIKKNREEQPQKL